jgi:DNA-binding NarL/FixJ family response regulator
MISRITEKQKVEDSKKFGASAYILKPLDLDELDKAIAAVTKEGPHG